MNSARGLGLLAAALLAMTTSAGRAPAQASKAPATKPKTDLRDVRPDAPYEATPLYVVEKMLELAKVGPRDRVYDIGSGDGRIVIMAAQKFGARAVGVELRAELYRKSAARVKELGLEKRAKIIHGDMFATDFSPATVITLYMLPRANALLKPQLEKQLRPGTRVVCHDYGIPGWTAENTITLPAKKRDPHKVILYRRP